MFGGDWFGDCQTEHEGSLALARDAALSKPFHLAPGGELNAINNKRLLHTVLPRRRFGTEKRAFSSATARTWPWVGVPAQMTVTAKCHSVPEVQTLAQWKLDRSQTHLASAIKQS